jgi:hypothetical protein
MAGSAPTAILTGTFAGERFDLRATFHLNPDYLFDRADVEGEIHGKKLAVRALGAEGGLGSTSTIAIDGTIGATGFELFATVSGDLTRAIVRGSLGGQAVRLDAIREESSRTVRIVGAYEGPVAVLAVIVGVLVYFL